jgi:TonB family protein
MLDRNDEQLAAHLSDLVRLSLERGELAEAESLLLRLLELKTAEGEDRPDVATVLASLATVRQALGRHESAERLWRRVLIIRERSLAPNHFAIARSVEHLADACAAQGKLEEALTLLQRAIGMQELASDGTSPSLSALGAKIADLRLLALQEGAGLRALRAGSSEPPRAAAMEPPPARADMIPGAQSQGTPTSHLLLMTPSGLYSDTETDSGAAADERDAYEPWRSGDARSPRPWWTSTAALTEQARGHWRQIAIAAAALAVVPLGIVASARSGREGPRPAPSEAALAAAPIERGEAAGVVASPTPSLGTLPDTTAAASAPGAPAATDSPQSATRPVHPVGTPADARGAVVRAPTMKSIQLPDAMGAAQSSMSRRMDSTLHAITGSAMLLGNGAQAPRRADGGSATAPPAEIAPPALAVGSPMPEYPASLRPEGVSGGVLAEFVVDSTGHADVSTLEVLHSDNRLFTAAVRKALPNMRFIPAESSGHRVPQRLQMPFSFTAGGR